MLMVAVGVMVEVAACVTWILQVITGCGEVSAAQFEDRAQWQVPGSACDVAIVTVCRRSLATAEKPTKLCTVSANCGAPTERPESTAGVCPMRRLPSFCGATLPAMSVAFTVTAARPSLSADTTA